MAALVPNYTIYDFETGGLSALKNPMTELGMLGIKGDTLEELDRFALLCQPYYNPDLVYEPKALEVTGISIDLLLREGVDIKQIVDRAIEHFQKLNPTNNFRNKPYLVGHNVRFDNSFLAAIFKHCKKDLSKWVNGDVDFYGNFVPATIDTLDLMKMAFGNDTTMTNFKLGTCVEKSGLQQADAHRAMSDIVPTKDLLIQCIKKLRSQGQDMEKINKEYSFRHHFQF